jgi:ribose transport system substrate-binding protein
MTAIPLMFFAALAVVVAACSSPPGSGGSAAAAKPTKGFTIGFEEGVCANSWRKEMLYAFNQLAAKYEKEGIVKKTIVTCANDSVSGQIANINTMIGEHVNALLLIANSGSAVVPVVTKATNDGIVTVPFNLPLTGGSYSAYVGTNPCLKAQDNARSLVSFVGGKPGGIVALGGTPGNSYTEEGWACAQKILAAGQVKVLGKQTRRSP